ncbi:MAG: hypothetical protein ACK56C_05115 [Alphaproteobacteria bacterium]|jgi:hypothetical protein
MTALTVAAIIRLMQNHLASLNNLMVTAVALGDVDHVLALQAQIDQTALTITQLQDSL